MRILVDAGELAQSAAHVARAIDPKDTDHLAMQLSAHDGTLTLSTGGGMLGFSRMALDADTIEEGGVTVNGPWLTNLTAALPDGEANVEDSNDELKLTCGSTRLKMRVMNGAVPDWPKDLPEMGDIDPEAFARMVESVSRSTRPRDPNAPAFGGVSLTGTGGKLTARATDRYRAAIASIDSTFVGECLPPVEWLKNETDHTTRFGSDGLLVAAGDERRLDVGPVIDGTFPNTDRLFFDPATAAQTITVDDMAGLDRVVRSLRSLDVGKQATVVDLQPTRNGLTVQLSGDDLGGSMHVEATCEGAYERFSLNAAYLSDALAGLGGHTVVFSVTNPLKPVLLTDPDNPSVRQLINPVRRG